MFPQCLVKFEFSFQIVFFSYFFIIFVFFFIGSGAAAVPSGEIAVGVSNIPAVATAQPIRIAGNDGGGELLLILWTDEFAELRKSLMNRYLFFNGTPSPKFCTIERNFRNLSELSESPPT